MGREIPPKPSRQKEWQKDTCWKSGTKVDTPSAGIRRGLQLLPVAVIQLMLEHAAARGAEVGRVARGIAER